MRQFENRRVKINYNKKKVKDFWCRGNILYRKRKDELEMVI